MISLFSLLVNLLGCSSVKNSFKSLSVDEFEQSIADTNIFRLDARTAEEYVDGHIKGAILIDVLQSDFIQKALQLLPNKKRPVAVYCRSGRRSKTAAEILTKNGYKVIELDHGFNAWKAAGKPISREE